MTDDSQGATPADESAPQAPDSELPEAEQPPAPETESEQAAAEAAPPLEAPAPPASESAAESEAPEAPAPPAPEAPLAPPPPPPPAAGPGSYTGEMQYSEQAPATAPGQPVQPCPKNKVAAGVLGILLGWLGIHKFYLGYTTEGLIMLAVSLVSFGVLSWIPAIIGLVEGIIYLTTDDRQWCATYVYAKKGWF
jgi:TM2 domain-containing membrane protein YozV